jgi:tRNA modification GTPase
VVTTLIAVDGWLVELADTAGQRAEAGPVEAQGIAVARTAARGADLCLWVLDASAPPAWPDFTMPGLRLVVNKVDLRAAWDLGQAGEAVRVSARTGAGLDELCQAMTRWLVQDPPPPGAAVPFTAALCERLEEVKALLAGGRVLEGTQRLATLL